MSRCCDQRDRRCSCRLGLTLAQLKRDRIAVGVDDGVDVGDQPASQAPHASGWREVSRGVYSRHLMDWIEDKLLWVFCPGFGDELVGSEAFRCKQRRRDDRVRCGIVACNELRQSSSGSSVCFGRRG